MTAADVQARGRLQHQLELRVRARARGLLRGATKEKMTYGLSSTALSDRELGSVRISSDAPAQRSSDFGESIRSVVEHAFAGERRADDAAMRAVHEELESLRKEVSVLSARLRSHAFTRPAALVDLGVEHLVVRQPIPIVLEEYDDEALASWPEVDLFGSGDSESEAILDLKTLIVELYEDLSSTPDDALGRLPLSQKRALAAVINTRARG